MRPSDSRAHGVGLVRLLHALHIRTTNRKQEIRRSWSSRYAGAGGRTTWSGTSLAAWSSSRARAAPRHHGGHFGGVAAVAGMSWSSWARRSGRDAHDRADAYAPRLLVGLWWWRDELARVGNVDGQGASELTGADRRAVRWKRDGSYDQRWARARLGARHRVRGTPAWRRCGTFPANEHA